MFLVIDDMQIRHDTFDKLLAPFNKKVLHAFNVREAILSVLDRWSFEETSFDVIFLDYNIDSGDDKRDVVHFCWWIVELPHIREFLKNTKFFIHSCNPVGAENMAAVLRTVGFTVIVKPFSAN